MKRAVAQFFRFTIAKKLLLGFLFVGTFTILIALIALSNLQRLNEINRRIIERDVPLVEITDKMIEALLAQELFEHRSAILQSSEMEALFWKRSEEFKRLLQQMGNLPDVHNLPLDRLTTFHEDYNHFFKTGLEKRRGVSSRAFQDHERQIRRKQEELIQLVKEISRDARADQNEKSLMTLSIGQSAFWITIGLSIGGLLLGIIIVLTITRNISHSINQLKLSTWYVKGGKFDQLPKVRNQDELGDLSQAFQSMVQRLKQVEEEREGLIHNLQDALAKIKRLHGLLPICASCKKIRDNEGYWNQIESYIEEHSEAEFTHGICPECSKKLYGISLDKDGHPEKG